MTSAAGSSQGGSYAFSILPPLLAEAEADMSIKRRLLDDGLELRDMDDSALGVCASALV